MGNIELRAIDRVILVAIGVLVTLWGIYIIGPWYMPIQPEGDPAPLYSLLNTKTWIAGIFHLMVGPALIVTVFKWKRFLPSAIMGCFMARLYALFGVISTGYFLPPNYLTQATSVVILGAYFIYVRLMIRDG